MATNTPNLNLVKPDLTDFADIRVLNGNMDIIDNAVGGLDYVKDVTKSDTGLKFTKKDDTVVNVPLDYMPTAGGNFTGDVTIKEKTPVYLLDYQTNDTSEYILHAYKYSDGSLKNVIKFKEVSPALTSNRNVTFLIPFIDVDRIECYSCKQSTQINSNSDAHWSVGKLSTTGCNVDAGGGLNAQIYILLGYWK